MDAKAWIETTLLTGPSPSRWGNAYLPTIRNLYTLTGFAHQASRIETLVDYCSLPRVVVVS